MRDKLVSALANGLPQPLAEELVDDFLQTRLDAASRTLGRTAPGKLVESVAQSLQHLKSGSYDSKPNVDKTLRDIESATHLDEGLRICAARIARSMYALRNKRNIAHKGEVDPNGYDLNFLMHAAQWILAELVRTCSVLTMEEAGALIEAVQAPVGGIVEDFGTKRIVLPDLSAPKTILVLLHSRYPETVGHDSILESIDRKKKKTVENALRALWREKRIEGSREDGYQLTRLGAEAAAAVLQDLYGGDAT